VKMGCMLLLILTKRIKNLMKKYTVLVLMLPAILQAQELDTLAADTLEKLPPPYFGGIYLVPGGKVSRHTG